MKLTNTLTGRKEEFVPLGPEVKLYVCGITPYDSAHVGHAMSYIVFDVLRRYLEYRGYQVHHVQNFTDVEDKIIARAARMGVPPEELAERHIAGFFDDMDALNVQRAHVYPRASREIPKIIEMIQGLIEKGYAYEASGDVYLRVTKVPDYGKLSHRTLEGMVAGARVEPSSLKEHPMDFALWKAAKPGEPAWDSPWGQGRPGWHIECSSMAMTYLDETIDIHGGGQDLVFPHHENEIAQSEAFTGKRPFSRFWLHNGLLLLGQDKMSKSLGNLISIGEALRQYSPDGIRIFVLGSHYRSPLAFSHQALSAAEQGAARLRAAANAPDTGSLPEHVNTEVPQQRFLEAMDDDLNTPRALAALFDLATEINRARQEGRKTEKAQQVLRELASVLGLTLQEPEGAPQEAAPFIELLVQVRNDLRKAKQWALADLVRNRLSELGITLEDAANGTIWKRKVEKSV